MPPNTALFSQSIKYFCNFLSLKWQFTCVENLYLHSAANLSANSITVIQTVKYPTYTINALNKIALLKGCLQHICYACTETQERRSAKE